MSSSLAHLQKKRSEITVVSGHKVVPHLQIQIVNQNVVAANKAEQKRSQKVVNHITKKVETRVQRQILLSDGKVIADSGPQIISRTVDDSLTEQTEGVGGSSNPNELGSQEIEVCSKPIVGDRSETRQVTKKASKECFQYHDEVEKELSGREVLETAKRAPTELLEPMENELNESAKRTLCHYSNKGKTVIEKNRIREISRLGLDGSIITETTRTRQQEEVEDEELPENDRSIPAPPKITYSRTSNTRAAPYAQHGRLAIGYMPINATQPMEPAKKSQTNNWIDNHFGETSESDGSDRQRSMTLPRKSILQNIERNQRQQKQQQQQQQEIQQKAYFRPVVQDKEVSEGHRNYMTIDTRFATVAKSANNSNYFTLPKDTKFARKEDASCQASFSGSDDEEEDDEDYCNARSESEDGSHGTFVVTRAKDVHGDNISRRSSTNSFYFGQNEPESKVEPDKGKFISTFHTKLHHGSVDQSLKNWSSDHSVPVKVQVLNPESLTTVTGNKVYRVTVNNDNMGTLSRRAPESRQRSAFLCNKPPPPPLASSTRQNISYVNDRNEYELELENLGSSGTWTKSKGKRLSPNIQSSPTCDLTAWPDFSPLSSPLEILSITSTRPNYR